MDFNTALATLELKEDCTAHEVRTAYLDLVRVWHPDRFTDPRLRRKAEDRLKEINEAYRVLLGTAPRPSPAPERPSPPEAERAANAVPPRSVSSRLSDWWIKLPVLGRLGIVLGSLWGGALVFEATGSLGPASPPPQLSSENARREPAPVSAQVQRPLATSRPLGIVSFTPSCDSEEVTSPRSGAELGGRHRGGLGSLAIKNGSESDAIAVMVEEATRLPRRAIYIRRGETGLVTSIPVGGYRVLFQLGDVWLATKRFCNISSTSEFERALQFEERDKGNATEFSRFELTLYEVPGGNARTDRLANTPLMLPEP